MLISNWFDLITDTSFFVVMGIGVGIIGSMIMIIKVIRSKEEIVFSWGELFEKTPPFVQNPLQTLVTAIVMIPVACYVLFFGMGWFYMYLDSVKAFFTPP